VPAARAVERNAAGRGRERDEGAERRVEPREARRRNAAELQPPTIGPDDDAAFERVDTAGVEDHDVDAAADLAQPVHELPDVGALAGNLVLALRLGVDRQQVVAAARLHAVPGIEEHTNVGVDGAQHERPQALDQFAQSGVLAQLDVESERLQGRGDRLRVRHWIPQRRAPVAGVSDHERAFACVVNRWHRTPCERDAHGRDGRREVQRHRRCHQPRRHGMGIRGT